MDTKRGDSNPVLASAPLESDQINVWPNYSQEQFRPVGSMAQEGQGQPFYPLQDRNGPITPPVYTISYPQSSMGLQVADMFYPPGPPPPYFLLPHMPAAGTPPPYFYPGATPPPFPSTNPSSTPMPHSHIPEPQPPREVNQERRQRVRLVAVVASTDCNTRIKFLRKVYIFHLVQMVVLNAFLYLSVYLEKVKRYFQHDYAFTITAIISEFMLVVMLLSSSKLRKDTSLTYTLLFCCSLALSFLVAMSAPRSSGKEILLATSLHTITACVLLISAGKKMALRTWSGVVIVVIPVIAGCVTYYSAFPNRLDHIIIAGMGAMVMSLCVDADMFLILRGTHKYFPPTDESLCLSCMMLQKLVFGFCFVICVLFVIF